MSTERVAPATDLLRSDVSTLGRPARLWSAAEVADYLGISTRHVEQMAREGEFAGAARQVGRYWRFSPEKIVAWWEAGL